MRRPTDSGRMMIPALVITAAALALTCQPARAGTAGFSQAVRQVEAHYHVHRSHPWLLGFAGFAVSVWRPYGTGHVKLALFENPRVADESKSEEFVKVVRAALGPDWQTFIRDYSPQGGERTWIFARAPASARPHKMTLLIASMDQDDAVIIRVSMDVRRWQNEMNSMNARGLLNNIPRGP